MKKAIQALLQRILGYHRYLFVFARVKSAMILRDRNEGDFRHFLSFITPTDTVLDIGANIGIMTTHLSRAAKQVFAFEPIPDNIFTLKRIIAHYGLSNVTLFECALGNHQTDLEMVLPVVSNVKMQGLAHAVDPTITEYNEGIRFTVPQYRLDDLDALKPHPIKAIKLDVENFEYQVLLGGLELIRRNLPVIYCELWDNDNRRHCFELIRSLGYRIEVVANNRLVPFEPGIHTGQNFFFLP